MFKVTQSLVDWKCLLPGDLALQVTHYLWCRNCISSNKNNTVYKAPKALVYAGTSGLVLPVPNKLSYPEAFKDKSRLTYYGSLFNTVEINSSFRQAPRRSTVVKWAASVPPGFKFTFKLWRGITHNPGLAFDPQDVFRFVDCINAVGNKKGCLLVQFPGKVTVAERAQLSNLLAVLRAADSGRLWTIALEFRHSSWYNQEIAQLLHQYHMIPVLHDFGLLTPWAFGSAGDTVYLRFHGPEKGYRGSYSFDTLSVCAARIGRWLAEHKTVYVYFNNTLGDAVHNLKTLNRLMAGG